MMIELIKYIQDYIRIINYYYIFYTPDDNINVLLLLYVIK